MRDFGDAVSHLLLIVLTDGERSGWTDIVLLEEQYNRKDKIEEAGVFGNVRFRVSFHVFAIVSSVEASSQLEP